MRVCVNKTAKINSEFFFTMRKTTNTQTRFKQIHLSLSANQWQFEHKFTQINVNKIHNVLYTFLLRKITNICYAHFSFCLCTYCEEISIDQQKLWKYLKWEIRWEVKNM